MNQSPICNIPKALSSARRLLKWLVSLLHMADEEQKDAGIYLGDKLTIK